MKTNMRRFNPAMAWPFSSPLSTSSLSKCSPRKMMMCNRRYLIVFGGRLTLSFGVAYFFVGRLMRRVAFYARFQTSTYRPCCRGLVLRWADSDIRSSIQRLGIAGHSKQIRSVSTESRDDFPSRGAGTQPSLWPQYVGSGGG
jgi:hypothetical protein